VRLVGRAQCTLRAPPQEWWAARGHSGGRSHVGQVPGGFEESVELAGDVADQAASDLAVGLALGSSPLGVGAGGWVIAQPGRDDQVQGWLSWRSPDRFSRTRTVWPLEAGMGRVDWAGPAGRVRIGVHPVGRSVPAVPVSIPRPAIASHGPPKLRVL
jgi:hypothetical protein